MVTKLIFVAVPTTESETISAKSPEVASMKVPEKPFAKISPVVATKKVPAETLDEEPEPGAKPLEQHFFLLTQGAKRWRYDRDDLTVKIKKLGGTVCDTFAEIFEVCDDTLREFGRRTRLFCGQQAEI